MKKLVYIISLTFLIFGCGKSSINEEEDQNPENPDGNPNQGSELMVNLVFPHEDGLCNLGTNITPTQSTVIFEWQASSIAESYTIVVENLNTGHIIQDETTEDKVGIVIDRATPYSWYVESTSGSKTETSDTWKFYNAGPGVQTYAPFSTVINSPTMASSISTTNVTLQWTGSDVDNDIVGYDVYLSPDKSPSLHTSDITASELNVNVSSGAIYYWKVITKDAAGNTSDSGIFQFKVL